MAKRSIFLLAATALVAGAAWAAPKGDPVVAAALKTERAGSAKIALRSTIAGGGETVTFTGSGILSGRAARIAMRFPSPLAAGGSGLTMELILRMERGSPVLYMRFDLLKDQLPAGKRWVRIDLQREAKKLGFDLTALMGGSGFDDSSFLRFGRGTKKLGAERIRGRWTTRYRTGIDLEEVARRDPQRAAAVRKLISMSGIRTLTMDAWVDSAGFLRQARQSFAYRDPSSGLKIRATTTTTYVSFGPPVAIKAPPAREVVEASALGG